MPVACRTRPGAWETAMMNRLEGCTLPRLWDALYQEKSLPCLELQGALWFPTGQSEVFLTPLIAQNGEDPWKVHSGQGPLTTWKCP